MERLTNPPSDQWWTLNGQDFMNAMNRAHRGEAPDLIYLEFIANSQSKDFGTGEETKDYDASSE